MEKLGIQTYNKFLGVYDADDAWEVPKAEGAIALKTCTNMDINKNYKLKFRPGQTLVLAGNYRNLWSNGSIFFATKDNNLYRIYPEQAYNTELLYTGINEDQLSYANVGDLIYITNNSIILAYENNVIRALRSPNRTYRGKMPAGHLIELFKSRMFIAKEVDSKHLLIQSEAANYEQYDERDDTSFQAFTEKLTMLSAVGDGLFVSSDRTYFLNGSNLSQMRMTRVDDYKAIPGTARKIRGVTVKGEYYSDAVIWESESGICIGGNGGKFTNLTEGRKDVSSATIGASYINISGEITQFVVNTKGG